MGDQPNCSLTLLKLHAKQCQIWVGWMSCEVSQDFSPHLYVYRELTESRYYLALWEMHTWCVVCWWSCTNRSRRALLGQPCVGQGTSFPSGITYIPVTKVTTVKGAANLGTLAFIWTILAITSEVAHLRNKNIPFLTWRDKQVFSLLAGVETTRSDTVVGVRAFSHSGQVIQEIKWHWVTVVLEASNLHEFFYTVMHTIGLSGLETWSFVSHQLCLVEDGCPGHSIANQLPPLAASPLYWIPL